MRPTSKKNARARPTWERGYRGHVYWLGKQKLGKVSLAGKQHYRWQAGGRTGDCNDLEQAKRAVEYAVLMADKQLDLFSD